MKILRSTCTLLSAVLAAASVSAQALRPAELAASPATVPGSVPAASPEAVRAEYNAILSHLDPGGDLLVVANTDGVIEEFVETLRCFSQLVPTAGDSGSNAFTQAADHLPAFIKSSGLYAVDGLGLSIVPRADGLNTMKAFVYRDPAAAQLPFWQGLIGGAPKRMTTLEYLPADTVLVRAGTADPRQLWKLIGDAARQVGGPDAARAFDAFVNDAGKNLGTNLNSVIASLDSEQFFSLQLSTTQTMQLPAPNADASQPAVSIPVPSLLAGCAVRDATLLKAMLQELRRMAIPVLCSTNGATTFYTVNMPLPLPFPVTPTFAVHRNMFLFGSTLEIVRNAFAAADGPGGPRLPASFQKAFEGMPKQCNGVAFVDRRFSDTLATIQTHFLNQAPNGAGMAGAMAQLMQRQQPGQVALVFVNEKDGISVRGTSSESGRQVMLAMTVAPVAMLSAIAIPSFVKARSSARNSACINNLRLIDHAKQQWAVENNKAATDKPAAAELQKYFKGGRFPACPQGGTYSINAVNEAPTCSHPGHELPE